MSFSTTYFLELSYFFHFLRIRKKKRITRPNEIVSNKYVDRYIISTRKLRVQKKGG